MTVSPKDTVRPLLSVSLQGGRRGWDQAVSTGPRSMQVRQRPCLQERGGWQQHHAVAGEERTGKQRSGGAQQRQPPAHAPPIVQDAQQDVHHVCVSLFNFIEENDRVRAAPA